MYHSASNIAATKAGVSCKVLRTSLTLHKAAYTRGQSGARNQPIMPRAFSPTGVSLFPVAGKVGVARAVVYCVGCAPSMLSMLLASRLVCDGAWAAVGSSSRQASGHEPQAGRAPTSGADLQAGRTHSRRTRRRVRGMRPTPVSRFSWDALNVTSATQCGWSKCYFPSQREDEGWLVGQPSKCLRPQCRDAAGQLLSPNQIPDMVPPTSWFPPYIRAWALAEELRAGFGVDHLMRGSPLLATLPQAQATYMNAKIKALDRNKRPTNRRKWKIENATQTQYLVAGLHPVQGVYSCSYPECMLLRCARLVPPLTAQDIEGFVANAPNKTKVSQGIHQGLALVQAMVKAHPCLKVDFQVFLRNDGAVLNVDLDRCDDYGVSWKLALVARIPGFCEHRPDQVVFDKVLGQLYERLRQ